MLQNKPNGLKNLGLSLIAGAALLWGAGAQATTITFSEVPLFTADPVISGYSFSAGDGTLWEDTYVDDWLTSGNPYLANGWDSNNDLGYGASFASLISIDTAAVGGVGFDTTISLDAAFESALPSGDTLFMNVYLGSVLQGTDSILQTLPTINFESLSIVLSDIAFDSIVLFNEFGATFIIDNFVVNSVDNTGGGGNGGTVPEPSTLLLFGAALFGLGATRRIYKQE